MELVRDLVPKTAAIALLVNPNNPNADKQAKEMKAAAATLGLQSNVERRLASGFRYCLRDFGRAASRRDRRQCRSVFHQPAGSARRVGNASCGTYDLSGSGVCRGGRPDELRGQLCRCILSGGLYAGRILKGERPADLPIIQPTKFELVINLKAAKALGLTLPPGLLSVADEVIE